MITGIVNDREARIQISIRGPQQRELEIDAVVDTGLYCFTLVATRSHRYYSGTSVARHWPWNSFRWQ